MARVTARDRRAFEFPKSLTGQATLIGPKGGRYNFDADLLRQFLRWAKDNNVKP